MAKKVAATGRRLSSNDLRQLADLVERLRDLGAPANCWREIEEGSLEAAAILANIDQPFEFLALPFRPNGPYARWRKSAERIPDGDSLIAEADWLMAEAWAFEMLRSALARGDLAQLRGAERLRTAYEANRRFTVRHGEVHGVNVRRGLGLNPDTEMLDAFLRGAVFKKTTQGSSLTQAFHDLEMDEAFQRRAKKLGGRTLSWTGIRWIWNGRRKKTRAVARTA